MGPLFVNNYLSSITLCYSRASHWPTDKCCSQIRISQQCDREARRRLTSACSTDFPRINKDFNENKGCVRGCVSVTDTFNILPFSSDQSVWSYLRDCRRSNERRMSGRVPTAPQKVGRQEPVNKAHTPGNSQSPTFEAWQVCHTDRREIPIKILSADPLPHTPHPNIFIYPQDFLWGRDVIYTSLSYLTNIWTVIACAYQSFTFFIFSLLFLLNLTQQYPAQDEGIALRQILRRARFIIWELKYNVEKKKPESFVLISRKLRGAYAAQRRMLSDPALKPGRLTAEK